jgi:hypothetical protein
VRLASWQSPRFCCDCLSRPARVWLQAFKSARMLLRRAGPEQGCVVVAGAGLPKEALEELRSVVRETCRVAQATCTGPHCAYVLPHIALAQPARSESAWQDTLQVLACARPACLPGPCSWILLDTGNSVLQ